MNQAHDRSTVAAGAVPPSIASMLEQSLEEAPRDPLRREIDDLRQGIERRLYGQERLVERLLIAALAEGHLLLADTPGLVQARAIEGMGAGFGAPWRRLYGGPGLASADLTGAPPSPASDAAAASGVAAGSQDLLLIEDLNRVPAAVQGALAEAMDGRQAGFEHRTSPAPDLFLVIATEACGEEEGVGPLPPRWRERFLMQVHDPSHAAERAALRLQRALAQGEAQASAPIAALRETTLPEARRQVLDLHLASGLEDYLVQLVQATRAPEAFAPALIGWLRAGAGPGAGFALERCARARAWLEGRDYVSPDDVHAVVADVLRHRLLLSDEAKAGGRSADAFVARLLDQVPVP